MSAEHSELPWSTRPTKDDSGHIITDASDSWRIAKVHTTSYDAQYIVKACNAYDTLTEALRVAIEAIETDMDAVSDETQLAAFNVLDELRNALANAQGDK